MFYLKMYICVCVFSLTIFIFEILWCVLYKIAITNRDSSCFVIRLLRFSCPANKNIYIWILKVNFQTEWMNRSLMKKDSAVEPNLQVISLCLEFWPCHYPTWEISRWRLQCIRTITFPFSFFELLPFVISYLNFCRYNFLSSLKMKKSWNSSYGYLLLRIKVITYVSKTKCWKIINMSCSLKKFRCSCLCLDFSFRFSFNTIF